MLTLRHILETLVSHDCAKVSSDYRRCSVVEGEVRGGADSGGDPLDTAAGVCKKLLKKRYQILSGESKGIYGYGFLCCWGSVELMEKKRWEDVDVLKPAKFCLSALERFGASAKT